VARRSGPSLTLLDSFVDNVQEVYQVETISALDFAIKTDFKLNPLPKPVILPAKWLDKRQARQLDRRHLVMNVNAGSKRQARKNTSTLCKRAQIY
jgi:hypothetical protein